MVKFQKDSCDPSKKYLSHDLSNYLETIIRSILSIAKTESLRQVVGMLHQVAPSFKNFPASTVILAKTTKCLHSETFTIIIKFTRKCAQKHTKLHKHQQCTFVRSTHMQISSICIAQQYKTLFLSLKVLLQNV